MINALVFHQNLAGQRGVRNLDQIAPDGALNQSDLLAEWRKILDINYWSIFSVASDLLRSVNPPRAAASALRAMRAAADKLVALGVSQSGDLAGAVFQRLIADRKFLATFYTRPESATLLAHLAMPDAPDVDRWKDPRRAMKLPNRRLRLRHRDAHPRRLPPTEPAPLARRRRPPRPPRPHDGKLPHRLRRPAVRRPPHRLDPIIRPPDRALTAAPRPSSPNTDARNAAAYPSAP